MVHHCAFELDNDSKYRLGTCMVEAGLVQGQIEQENFSRSFDIFWSTMLQHATVMDTFPM